MAEGSGYRGYIGSRQYLGNRVPQHVQNLVIRDYCQRKSLLFKLSAVEYAMPNSFLILEQVIDEAKALDGIVCYSIFMLPPNAAHRRRLFRQLLDCNAELHSAVEEVRVSNEEEMRKMEDMLVIQNLLPRCSGTSEPFQNPVIENE